MAWLLFFYLNFKENIQRKIPPATEVNPELMAVSNPVWDLLTSMYAQI